MSATVDAPAQRTKDSENGRFDPAAREARAAQETARVLEAELSARLAGEVRFDHTLAAALAPTAPTLQLPELEPVGVVVRTRSRSTPPRRAVSSVSLQPRACADPARGRWIVAGAVRERRRRPSSIDLSRSTPLRASLGPSTDRSPAASPSDTGAIQPLE
jgi:hypothetical protein